MLPRWEESPSKGLGELHPLETETLEPEELETEVPQKQEEEEELGILQYLDQLEQVTARYLGRLVLCYSHKVKLKEIFCFWFLSFFDPKQMDLQEWISFVWVWSKIFLKRGYQRLMAKVADLIT